jgi:hypothetical protein
VTINARLKPVIINARLKPISNTAAAAHAREGERQPQITEINVDFT